MIDSTIMHLCIQHRIQEREAEGADGGNSPWPKASAQWKACQQATAHAVVKCQASGIFAGREETRMRAHIQRFELTSGGMAKQGPASQARQSGQHREQLFVVKESGWPVS